MSLATSLIVRFQSVLNLSPTAFLWSQLTLIKLYLAVPALVFAHGDMSFTFEYHSIDTEIDVSDECHCHVPGEDPVEVSCKDYELTMESLLELEKFDQDLYFGLRVEPENTCSEYFTSAYPYGSTLDEIKSKELGAIFGAYENQCFDAYEDVDVDHLVAKKEAHDSGLCAADGQTRINFTNDLENIALASPSVNRSKSARDPADWLPDNNECWYVWQYLHVKRKYDLTIDKDEKNAIDKVLQNCTLEDLILEVDDSCTLPNTTTVLQDDTSEPG